MTLGKEEKRIMIEKILNKIPSKELYEDLFGPGMKKAGEALETVLDGANLVLLPLKLINQRSRVYLKKNLEEYNKKINHSKELNVGRVPEYVGLPIIDKLVYLDQNALSELFINLLTKASFDETLKLAHPTFLSILNKLSSDEAKLLFALKEKTSIPFIDLYFIKTSNKLTKPVSTDESGTKSRKELKEIIAYQEQESRKISIKAAWNLTGLEKTEGLDFPKNIDVYIENLTFNGLIKQEPVNYLSTDDVIYDDLILSVYSDTIARLKKNAKKELIEEGFKYQLEIRKGFFHFTEIGKMFLKACVFEINKNVV